MGVTSLSPSLLLAPMNVGYLSIDAGLPAILRVFLTIMIIFAVCLSLPYAYISPFIDWPDQGDQEIPLTSNHGRRKRRLDGEDFERSDSGFAAEKTSLINSRTEYRRWVSCQKRWGQVLLPTSLAGDDKALFSPSIHLNRSPLSPTKPPGITKAHRNPKDRQRTGNIG